MRRNTAAEANTPADVHLVPCEGDLSVALQSVRADLQRLEAHFRATIEQLPIGLVHADTQDRITRFNTAFCTMLGFGPAEIAGKYFAEITYPDDVEGSAAALQRLWRGEVPFYAIEKRYIKKDGAILWARVTVAPLRDADGTLAGAIGILEDITERKTAEAEIERAHQELMRASREAGMAEIASNVLHNVGNVLNSLNISATVLGNHIRELKADAFGRAVAMLEDNAGDLVGFLAGDERGKRLPMFLGQLAKHMSSQQRSALVELESLKKNIEHIKEIVATQQIHAKRCSIVEKVDVIAVIEDSVALNRGAFSRHGVELIRQFEPVPPIVVERHKVLQILVNLELNAKNACEASGRPDKQVVLRVATCQRGVEIQVIDNGVGIASENLPKLFTHGFTTKKDGHGFGLHSAALAAQELKGTLEAFSAGVGQGAMFTLTLPLDGADHGVAVRRTSWEQFAPQNLNFSVDLTSSMARKV